MMCYVTSLLHILNETNDMAGIGRNQGLRYCYAVSKSLAATL